MPLHFSLHCPSVLTPFVAATVSTFNVVLFLPLAERVGKLPCGNGLLREDRQGDWQPSGSSERRHGRGTCMEGEKQPQFFNYLNARTILVISQILINKINLKILLFWADKLCVSLRETDRGHLPNYETCQMNCPQWLIQCDQKHYDPMVFWLLFKVWKRSSQDKWLLNTYKHLNKTVQIQWNNMLSEPTYIPDHELIPVVLSVCGVSLRRGVKEWTY